MGILVLPLFTKGDMRGGVAKILTHGGCFTADLVRFQALKLSSMILDFQQPVNLCIADQLS